MRKQKLEMFFLSAICLLAFFIPISQYLTTKLLLISLALSIMRSGISLKNLGPFIETNWILLLYLFTLSVGLLYTEEVKLGFALLETSASLIILPILSSNLPDRSSKFWRVMPFMFVFGVIIANLICLGNALMRDYQDGTYYAYYHNEYTDIINSHPVYLGYYICFAITFILYKAAFSTNRKNLIVGIVAIIYLIYSLVLTAGRVPFVATIFVFAFVMLVILFEKSRPVKFRVLILCLILIGFVLAALMLIQKPYLLDKFMLNPDNPYYTKFGGLGERMVLWDAAINANSNAFLGVGTGDYKIVLNEYFSTHNLSSYAEESYNSHNQYAQIYLSNGFLGLLAVCLLLGVPKLHNIFKRDIFGILVFSPFLIYAMTEVFLGRFQGVVFFAFLLAFFHKRSDFYFDVDNSLTKKVTRKIG